MVDSARWRDSRLHLRWRADLVSARRSIEPANGVLQRPCSGLDRYPGGGLHLSEHRPGPQLEQGPTTTGPAAGPPAGHPYPVRRAARALGALPRRTERHESQSVYRVRDRGWLDMEGRAEGVDVGGSDPTRSAGR